MLIASIAPAASAVSETVPISVLPWTQYRWQVIIAIILLLLQAALIAGLLVERRRRRAAELEFGPRLASIIHQLNEPLGVILTNAEAAELLLAADPPDLTQIKDSLDDIRQDDRRAGEIVQRLLDCLQSKETDRRSS